MLRPAPARASLRRPGRRGPAALGLALALAGLSAPAPASGAPAGTITGTVRFEGEPPERPVARRDTDPYCARRSAPADELVITGGKLKDVLIRITPGPAPVAATTTPAASPPPPVVIDQKDCSYAPHVVALSPGQQLVVRNSDGTFHNVHGTIAGKLAWNRPAAPGDPALTLDGSSHAGDVIDVVCDVHPWMHAYAVVVAHPGYAITGADGAFSLTGLAPGNYVVEAWHPVLGSKSVKLTIGKRGGAATAELTYRRSDAK